MKIVGSATLPKIWADDWYKWRKRDNIKDQQFVQVILLKLKSETNTLDKKLNLLLDGYLDGTIEVETYKNKKNELFNQKLALKNKISKTRDNGSSWLEPMKEFMDCTLQAQKIARKNTAGDELRSIAKNIGSNFFLKDKQLIVYLRKPFASLRAAGIARATVPMHLQSSLCVTPAGFEPAISRMKT